MKGSTMKKKQQSAQQIEAELNYPHSQSYERVDRNGMHHFYEYGKEVNRYRVWFQDTPDGDKHISFAHDKFGWLVVALDYGSAQKEAKRLRSDGKKAWIERINPKIE